MRFGEHEHEAQRGLPQALPAGERVLWQGAPAVRAMALHVFHLRGLALYFAALMLWRAQAAWLDGGGWAGALQALLLAGLLGGLAIGLLATIAWLVARTTVYTLTNRRVVMRVGVVLSVTFNVPLSQLDAVRQRRYRDGSGDVVLVLANDQRIAYLHLWPHARPWRFARPEPMLRALADASALAGLLAQTLSARSVPAVEQERGAVSPIRPTAEDPRLPWPRAA